MRRLFRLFDRRDREADLEAELAAHLEIEKAEQRAAGRSPEEAEQAARTLFGNRAKTSEDVRESWGWTNLARWMQDIRFGLRLLRRTPVWTAVVCGTLALGLGIGTAIFSVVHALLLAPLPYPDPDRIVAVSATTIQDGTPFNANPSLWKYWREHLTSVGDLALTRPVANFNLTGDGPPERLQGARTTFNLPRVLGVQPAYGRPFTEAEQLADAKVVLLSHGLWLRRFGGDPSVVGRKIDLNDTPHEVIGVMPPEFQYPDAAFEIWAPLFLPSWGLGHGYDYGSLVTGRLASDISLGQSQAELHALMRRLSEEFPEAYRVDDRWVGGRVEPLAERQAAAVRPTLLVLAAAAACLLALGCMNLAVLLIARASARSREIAVRIALGASGSRLRRQLLAEAIPLGVTGAAGALLLAHWVLRALVASLPANFPRIGEIGLSPAVGAFAIACGLAVVVAASLVPSRLAGRMQISGALQQGGRNVSAGNRTRNALVVAQVAIAVLLCFGGILFGRSLTELLRVQPGFTAERAVTMHLAVSRVKRPEDPQIAEYYRRLEERIEAIPDVVAAGFVNRLPLSGLAQTGGVEFKDREGSILVDWRSATPGFFPAMGIPLVRGRYFRDSDRHDSAAVCLIDSDLARRVFGSGDVLGKRLRPAFMPGRPNDRPWCEIVGVVGHVRNDNLETDTRAQVYWPETQRAQDRAALVVRTVGEPTAFVKAIVDEIHAEDSSQPVYDVRTMEDWIARSTQTRRLTASIVSLFGVTSMVLACLGLYGVISYSGGLRLREFGVRLALGASAAGVRSLVLGQAMRLAAFGAAIGLALCWPASIALRGLLFGVGSLDPIAWSLAPSLLIAFGILAALGPANRAAKTDPAVTLRAE